MIAKAAEPQHSQPAVRHKHKDIAGSQPSVYRVREVLSTGRGFEDQECGQVCY
jgi:hypothetical protein